LYMPKKRKDVKDMIAVLWAQEIMKCDTSEKANEMYQRCPRLLKEKVKSILEEKGFKYTFD